MKERQESKKERERDEERLENNRKLQIEQSNQ